MKVSAVDPLSPLYGYIRPGYSIVAINGRKVLDSIDYHYRIADERVKLTFADKNGRKLDFRFDYLSAEELGLTFDDGRVLTCKNNCIFCFVHQQPKGMRRALYVKDEDYRLSFTHGNFVTLSNVTGDDVRRIINQRLSPLYVSVHATDDTLRRCMLKNEKLRPIVPLIKWLTSHGIRIHTQVVVCPGINDGQALERTIDDLSKLYPGVASLAVVPVGLTRYRARLPRLTGYDSREAGEVIDYVERRQAEFLKQNGSRFVWPADEFYVLARREFPKRRHYEEMEQFENGVGMAREFITTFNRRRAGLKRLRSKRRALFMTGHSAIGFLTHEIQPYLSHDLSLKADFLPVTNRFWGETVTVSGLLTGQDLLREARRQADRYDVFVLPPNCLNHDNLFLDNFSLSQFESTLQKRVVIGRYNLAETIKEVYS